MTRDRFFATLHVIINVEEINYLGSLSLRQAPFALSVRYELKPLRKDEKLKENLIKDYNSYSNEKQFKTIIEKDTIMK